MNRTTFYFYQRTFFVVLLCVTTQTTTMMVQYLQNSSCFQPEAAKNIEELILHKAALAKDLPELTLLFNCTNVNVNAKDSVVTGTGNSALHWAARNGAVDIGKFLLEHGASVNIRNKRGDTPLHDAIHEALEYKEMDFQDNINFISLLLNHGANQSIKNNKGYTPDSYLANEVGGRTPYDGVDVKKDPFIVSIHNILLCDRLEDLIKNGPRPKTMYELSFL
jgi:hypothetical protein